MIHITVPYFFVNERKIERRSFIAECERERKTAKKLRASGAQSFRLSAERERKQFF